MCRWYVRSPYAMSLPLLVLPPLLQRATYADVNRTRRTDSNYDGSALADATCFYIYMGSDKTADDCDIDGFAFYDGGAG